jgi:glutathione transport system substrate-binding protein
VNQSNYWSRRRLSRRAILRGTSVGVAGLVGAALIGCSSGDDAGVDDPATVAPTAAGGGGGAAQATTAPPQLSVKKGGTIRFGGWGQARSLSPRSPGGGNHLDYLNLIGDSYLFIKADGTFDPSLGLWEEWEQPDGSTIVAKLQKGVNFHDGTPFDAEAVKAHLEFISVEENVPNNFFFSWMKNFDRAEAIDEHTVRISAKQPDASFLARFALQPGLPFSLKQVELLGDDELRQPALTGAYTVDSYTEDDGWVMKANPDYWGPEDGAPTFDVIDYKGIGDPKVKAAAMQAGDLDAGWFGASEESTLLLGADERFTGRSVSVAPTALGFNWSKPPLDDLRVRQAVASGVDKQKIVDIVYAGQSRPSESGLMAPDIYGSLDYAPYSFDLAEAKKYLDASGVETPVKMTYVYSGSGTAETLLAAQIYQETLRTIGIEIEIENAPSRGVETSAWYAGEYHFARFSPGVRPDPTMQYDLYASRNGPQPGSKFSADPIQDRVEELINDSISEFDADAREEVFFELHRVVSDNIVNSYAVADRRRWLFATDDIGGMDHPEIVTAPGGAGYRMRFLWNDTV